MKNWRFLKVGTGINRSHSYLYTIVVLFLALIACNAPRNAGDSPMPPGDPGDSDPGLDSGDHSVSRGVSEDDDFGDLDKRPIGFINHGTIDATVRAWTWIPLGKELPDTPSRASTVSTASTSPGMWPNSSRFISLPLGTYTFCIEWDEGDLDDDGMIDYFHYIDSDPVTLDYEDSDDLDMATEVDISAPPGQATILNGKCGAPPVTSGSVNVSILPGSALSFSTPPPVIAFANTQEKSPPAGVTVSDTCGGSCWRFSEILALLQPGQSLESTNSAPSTVVGLQFWGDTNDGWARVLVDGEEVWTGNTHGSDDNYPGGAFVNYLQISGLPNEPHTIRVEHMGQNDVTILLFGFGLASP